MPVSYTHLANENEVSVYFGVDGFEGRIKEVGVCYSDVNQLPTIADKTYVSESADGMHFIGPLLQKAYYMRPFVVTKDNDTCLLYTSPFVKEGAEEIAPLLRADGEIRQFGHLFTIGQ